MCPYKRHLIICKTKNNANDTLVSVYDILLMMHYDLSIKTARIIPIIEYNSLYLRNKIASKNETK